MTTEGHIAALKRRHEELERAIAQEIRHKAQDEMLIASLKRRKLEVKDEIVRFEASHAA